MLLMMLSCLGQAPADQIELVKRRFDSALRLFLEHVENIDRLGKPNRIDSAIGAAGVMCDDFKDTATKSFEHLGFGWLLPKLCVIQLKANFVLHLVRHRVKVIF